jgi:hypothetical protein
VAGIFAAAQSAILTSLSNTSTLIAPIFSTTWIGKERRVLAEHDKMADRHPRCYFKHQNSNPGRVCVSTPTGVGAATAGKN